MGRFGSIATNIEKPLTQHSNTGLLCKLHELESPAGLIQLICSFLSSRIFKESVEGEMSMPTEIQAGIRQGSPTRYQLSYYGSLYVFMLCVYIYIWGQAVA
jgi:hypothetical protein